MSSSEALFNAIRDNPDDVTARLIYADWLIDHGDPRGEFIQLQCAPPDEERKGRESELLRLHGDEWLAPVRAITDAEAVFRCGFVERIHLPAPAFLAHAANLFDLLPTLNEISLTESAAVIPALAACPDLARVRRLILHENHLSNQHLAVLVGSAHLAGLVGLDLSRNGITTPGIQALGRADLPGLRHLDLSYNPISEAEIRAVAAATSLHRLKTLRMVRNCVSTDDIVPLLRSPLRDALTEDTIGNGPIGAEGAPLLVEAARARGLQELRVELEDEAAEALATSSDLSELKSLNLACSSFLTGAGLATLLGAPTLTAMEKLDVGFSSDIKDRGARALADWPGLVRVSNLDLICIGLTAKGATAIARSKYASGLRWLRLSQNPVRDSGVKAIAQSKTMTGLVELHLHQCGVGDEGAKALAESANVESLTHLYLTTNQLTDEGAKALACSPRLARLQVLDLVCNGLTDAGGETLAASAHLTAMRQLDLRGCVFSRAVRRALVNRYGDGVLLTAVAESDEQSETRRPFLRAIAERPDEDEPRLAFADWLEASDPERAEFIRVQCELARPGEDDPRRSDLRDREQELLSTNLKRWRAELPDLPGIGWVWLGNRDNHREALDRGFFQSVRIGTLLQLEPQQEDVFGATVIRSLDLGGAHDVHGSNWTLDSRTPAQFAQAVAKLPGLRQLRTLHLGGNRLNAEALAILLEGDALSGLRELGLDTNPLGDAGLEALAACEQFASVETLGLSSVGASERGLGKLARSPHWPRLRHLCLDYNELKAGALRALFTSGRRDLESLSLKWNTLGDEGALALASCPALPDLRSLDLEKNYIRQRGLTALFTAPVLAPVRSLRVPDFHDCQGALTALAGSPHVRNLTHLDIDCIEATPDDFAALARSANLPELRELDIGQLYVEYAHREILSAFFDAPLTRQLTRFFLHLCPISPDDLRRLLDSLTPGRLRCLRLWRCSLGDEGARILAESPAVSGLRELDLFENGIGPHGAEALAKSPHLERLTDLKLATNPIGSAGAVALANSVHLGGLRNLYLRQCDIGTPGARAIAAAWRWERLAWLDLCENRIGTAGAEMLATSQSLRRLICLTLDQNQITPQGIEALAVSPRLITYRDQHNV